MEGIEFDNKDVIIQSFLKVHDADLIIFSNK